MPNAAEETRRVLLQSRAWRAIVTNGDLAIIARVGLLRIDKLTPNQHDEIQCWARLSGQYTTAPDVLKSYFDKIL